MQKLRVMFVCIHNSGRSQMGEAILRNLAGDRFEVHSAGLEAGKLNPLVVKAMAEKGIDMSTHYAKTVMEYLTRGEHFDYVITVCDETNAERCPVFPGRHQRIHWSFPDPSALVGSDEEKLAGIRPIRDAIEAKIATWISVI